MLHMHAHCLSNVGKGCGVCNEVIYVNALVSFLCQSAQLLKKLWTFFINPLTATVAI